ncbi:MAG: hypothetical protein ACXW6R_25040, partial [Candidatus Binatia bacterium]
VSFVVRLDFSIEHGNLRIPVRKICASHAIFELLQCRARKSERAAWQPAPESEILFVFFAFFAANLS